MSPFEPKIKTDIPKFQHVDFGCFGVILNDFGLIWVNLGQMFRTIQGQACSERSERSARSERSEHEHCSGPTLLKGRHLRRHLACLSSKLLSCPNHLFQSADRQTPNMESLYLALHSNEATPATSCSLDGLDQLC